MTADAPLARASARTFVGAQRAVVLLAALVLTGCGGSKGPPRHPVQEMTARASAKLELIELVVNDAERAQRVRKVYLQLVDLGHEFDLLRARALTKARADWQKRTSADAQTAPASGETLELVLAPPLQESKAVFERYTALMLEARSLLTQQEFEKLNKVR
ncbi:MAG TPA: hypothetical protein VIW29_01720 [Polyangiaceae bacterium]